MISALVTRHTLFAWHIVFMKYALMCTVSFPPGVHKALCSAKPDPWVFEAGFLENRLQPRALCHAKSALQSSHPTCLPLPFCVFSNFTGQKKSCVEKFKCLHTKSNSSCDMVPYENLPRLAKDFVFAWFTAKLSGQIFMVLPVWMLFSSPTELWLLHTCPGPKDSQHVWVVCPLQRATLSGRTGTIRIVCNIGPRKWGVSMHWTLPTLVTQIVL